MDLKGEGHANLSHSGFRGGLDCCSYYSLHDVDCLENVSDILLSGSILLCPLQPKMNKPLYLVPSLLHGLDLVFSRDSATSSVSLQFS